MNLTPRARVQAALHRELADRVPFTVYWLMFPRGQTERELRNAGVTIVERVPLFQVRTPQVEIVTREYLQEGELLQRRELRTPVGTIDSTFRCERTFGTSWWQTDYYVKSDADYEVLEFVLKDRDYTPAYEEYLLQEKRYGEDGYIVGNTEYTPMNLLIYQFLGLERFSIDLLDQPERILALCEILREKQTRMFEICADSPAELVLYGGNISQEAIGSDRFIKYFLPSIDEFCDTLHRAGKLAGCHLDASMATLAEAVAGSGLDVIEAFTPVPTCDMTVAQARRAFGDKILWINFPSSVHLEPERRIQAELLRILGDAIPGDRFLIGVTEDVPEDTWPDSFRILNHGLNRWGTLPLSEERLSDAERHLPGDA